MTDCKLFLWCGSLIRNGGEDEHRIITLEHMLNSVREFYPEVVLTVSISLLNPKHYDSDLFQRKDVTFCCDKEKKLQFEHFRLLNNRLNYDDNDYILFMDDDDLILSRVEYNNCDVLVPSHLVIPKNPDDLMLLNHKQMIDEIKQVDPDLLRGKVSSRMLVDLSGLIVKYKYVKDYFQCHPVPYLPHFWSCAIYENLYFMDTLIPDDKEFKLFSSSPTSGNIYDSNSATHPKTFKILTKPNVYHRLYSASSKGKYKFKTKEWVMQGRKHTLQLSLYGSIILAGFFLCGVYITRKR